MYPIPDAEEDAINDLYAGLGVIHALMMGAINGDLFNHGEI